MAWPQRGPRPIGAGFHPCLPHKGRNRTANAHGACRISLLELPQEKESEGAAFRPRKHYWINNFQPNVGYSRSLSKRFRVRFVSRTLTEAQEVSIVRDDLEAPAVPAVNQLRAIFLPQGLASNGLSTLRTHISWPSLLAKRLWDYLAQTHLGRASSERLKARPGHVFLTQPHCSHKLQHMASCFHSPCPGCTSLSAAFRGPPWLASASLRESLHLFGSSDTKMMPSRPKKERGSHVSTVASKSC